MHRVIDEQSLAESSVDADLAREMLTDMVRARVFDEKAVALQRRGWMSGYPPFSGQEASQVGAAHALDGDDWLFPTYRSNAMQFARGVPMSDILLFRRGYPEFHSDHDVPVFPQAIPIATQLPHAVGVGMAADYGDDDRVSMAYFGDGATSEGDFHEAMNFAGVFDAPVVFFCENNHWAISRPANRQTASESIAVKADAYGFDGIRVDGNDPLAVYEIVSSAREYAPALIESLTYRQGAHTTSDDPSRYRDEDPDLPEWRTADPIDRFADYLREEGAIETGFLEDARAEASEEVDAAVETAEDHAEADPDEMFTSAYETIPPRVEEQRASISRE
ncbi:thiamine pyrophosphate-dependent enzyme [Haloarculaceae archaeon H-GB2-1]|nr:thiamine pyrophosphate-dependent enzyme [Haloarculaceae archaeon H-GB1-1]MEA5388587.1 thiamine pyrophosphate-dependent enzyme [Haloarculaceae archaeon H-GB11]MEA5406641.1 thiamine pyrophosphate-dependent enzyme [Haloarculaceae archaeon H-GB2-1]